MTDNIIKVSELGIRGPSNYELWLSEGNVGSVDDFLNAQNTVAEGYKDEAVAAAATATAAATGLSDNLYAAAVARLYQADTAFLNGRLPMGRAPGDIVISRGQSNADNRPYTGGATKLDHRTSFGLQPNGGNRQFQLASQTGNPDFYVGHSSEFASLTAFVPDNAGATKQDGIALAARRPTAVFTTAIGSRDYAHLGPGTAPYTTFAGAVKLISKAMRANGIEPSPKLFMAWGESVTDAFSQGGGADTPFDRPTMLATLREWLDYDRAHIRAAIGRPLYDAPMFGISMGGPLVASAAFQYGPWKVVQSALTDFWMTEPGCYHCGGWYQYSPDEDNTFLHETGEKSILTGEQINKIMTRVANGEKWQPTHALPFYRVGAVVYVPIHTPRGNLVKDTANVPDPSNGGVNPLGGKNGFQYYYNGAEQTVVSAEPSGNYVVVTLAADPGTVDPTKEIVTIALQQPGLQSATQQPRAVFRDEDNYRSQFNPAVTHWNWIVPATVGMAA